MSGNSWGPGLVDFSPLANLGTAFSRGYDDARKRQETEERRAMYRTAAQGGDLNKIGLALLGTGDIEKGAALLQLGQRSADRDNDSKVLQSIFGGSGGAPAAPQASAPGGGAEPASLIQNESGGRWDAQNNAVGAGGQRGHFGRLQFGQARLQEAAAAGAIPQGTTPQAFMASPEIQQRAEAWHWNDIDNHIKQTGLDRAIGQSINGVPVTLEGMRAVAHLGGKKGLSQFIATGGRYNPADENGTRLSDYFSRHGGGPPTQVAAPVTPVQQAALSPPGVQVAENEQDVQRLEAEMAARQAAPVQMAQAAPQPGAPAADLPAQGASQAQGFVVPGTGQVIDQQTLASNPRLQRMIYALGAVKSDQARAAISKQLELEVADAKAKQAESATPESAREFVWARRNGLTTARTPAEYAREKADNAPTTKVIKQADGSEVAVQWDATARQWVPLAAPEGGNAVRPQGQKLTEQQSKDLTYHNRGLQALEAFEPIAGAYADGVSRIASNIPGGNYAVPERFQMAQQSGRNFLASILRKDTGAAITASEEKQYGEIFLPQPGDKPGTLQQKTEARKQAIDAIRGGLGTAEVLALGKRLVQRDPGQDAPAKPQDSTWQDLGGGIRIREKR